ncbi:MAG: T9SS type A sorting domain-containing protein, partial [Phaeodactylibacter sp.]|nr:T9SS type A sorting domain-containing protein [Phaeodactylibacter sp.]
TDLYSQNISGAHPLPNGNVMICSGRQGFLFEVSQEGQIVWDYINPAGPTGPVSQGTVLNNQNVFRATRYPTSYPAFEGKDLTPGDPIELNPIPIDCELFEPADTMATSISMVEAASARVRNTLVEDLLWIDNPNGAALSIAIYDLNGRLVFQGQSENFETQYSLFNEPAGLYVIYISNLSINRASRQRILKL